MNVRSETCDVLAEIKRLREGLPKRQGVLAQYVLAHPATVSTISLQQLCEACKISEPVVFSFCRRLGCKGFRAFKTALAGDLGARRVQAQHTTPTGFADVEFIQASGPDPLFQKLGRAYGDSLARVQQQYSSRNFQRAVDLLDKAQRMVIIGVGISGNIGFVAQQNFLRTGTAVTWTSDPNLAFTHLAPLKSTDVCLALSQTGRQRDTVEGAAFAKERKIKVIAITSQHEGPLASLADVLLLTQSEQVSESIRLSIGAELALPILFMTDALAIALGARRKQALQRRSELTRQAMRAHNFPARESKPDIRT